MNSRHKINLSDDNSKHPEVLKEVIENAVNLIDSIQRLRGMYNKEGDLPLLPFNSDCENMMIVAKAIGQEAMKFGLPGITEFCFFDEGELVEISKDDKAMEMNGLDEWVEEGLFDREFYVKQAQKLDSPYMKFMRERKANYNI